MRNINKRFIHLLNLLTYLLTGTLCGTQYIALLFTRTSTMFINAQRITHTDAQGGT